LIHSDLLRPNLSRTQLTGLLEANQMPIER
jgi:hypothetical protein